MKFLVLKIHLKMKNRTVRELVFEKNKINIVRGHSATGKTSIFQIFDYCFLSNETDIPTEIIAENIRWYGIQFMINDKKYFIARGEIKQNKVSNEYYFSSSGDIPEIIEINISGKELKKILEEEFSVDTSLKIPYGSRTIQAGSKISFRYFLMFITQLEDTITNTKQFFDKYDKERYRDALQRIFDLVIGVDNPENILVKEKINHIEKEIVRYEKKLEVLKEDKLIFKEDFNNQIKKAKEFGIFSEDVSTPEQAKDEIKRLIIDPSKLVNNSLNEVEELIHKRNLLRRKANLLSRLDYEFNMYKKLAENKQESLKPLIYLKENYDFILKDDSLAEFFSELEDELMDIKKVLRTKKPFSINIRNELKELTSEINNISEILKTMSQKDSNFKNQSQTLIFIGELKSQLKLLTKEASLEEISIQIQEFESERVELSESIKNIDEKRNLTIKLLEELISFYLKKASTALDIYQGHIPVFNFSHKTLTLRNTGEDFESNIGSTSIRLFLHLCLFLGLHELFIKKEIPFIPRILMLDQPSRPYFEDVKNTVYELEDIKSSDRENITLAFKLLDSFVEKMNEEYDADFQMIVVEHIPKDIWENAGLKNVHLVEEFFKNKNELVNLENKED